MNQHSHRAKEREKLANRNHVTLKIYMQKIYLDVFSVLFMFNSPACFFLLYM